MEKKIVVVGAGFSGTVLARKIAEELALPVTVVEKRPHIAGNMYDDTDAYGVLVQRYGPHVVVTDEWSVISYLQQYSEMVQYTVKELSFIDGKYVRLPFNFESIQQLIGFEKAETVIRKLRKTYPERGRVPVLDLANSEDPDIAGFGNLLFEKSYRNYCAKMWNIPVEKLDKTIMNRSAMDVGYDERYLNKDFQFIPSNGFTGLFERMLDHPNITVQLNCNALDHIVIDEENRRILYDGEELRLLVYTGALDELFHEKYGELPYRSLDIRYDWYDCDRMYPETIISYPQAEGYVRKTEYKFMMRDHSAVQGTTVATEYPIAYTKDGTHAPFYPVITDENKKRYAKYLKEAEKYKNIFLCGRLAEFRYYNMDDCILHAFDVFRSVSRYIKGENDE